MTRLIQTPTPTQATQTKLPQRRLPSRRTVGVIGLLVAGGCSAWRVEPVPPAQFVREQKPEVVQVIREDGTKVEFYTPSLVGDSLKGFPTEAAIKPLQYPLSSIRAVATKHFNLGKSALAALVIGGGVVLYALLQSLNQNSVGN